MTPDTESMPKLVIHIGGSKCGSSAIQNCLARNAEALRKRGVLVPTVECAVEGRVLGQQIWFFQNLLKLRRDEARNSVASALNRLRPSGDDTDLHTVVLSGENLSNPFGFGHFFRDALDCYDVRVVIYIRRQDDWLVSGWQQWGVKTYADFSSWWKEVSYSWVDWDACLRDWEETFGTERINVRLFERDRLLSGDAVADFLALLGLDETGFDMTGRNANRSFDDSVTLVTGRLRDLFRDEHDNAFYNMLAQYGGSSVFKQERASALLPLDQRLAIFAEYAPGNRRLKERYFADDPSVPETLFKPPTSDEVAALTEEELMKRSIDHLFRVVFGLYKDIEALRKR